MSSRLHCRPCAFESFARQVPTIDTDGSAGLLRAALAICKHEMGDVDCDAVERQLQGFADSVCERVPHLVESIRTRQPVNPEPVLAHLHEVLFDEYQLRGNMDDYYDPSNSYIPAVLETRRGIPITLTLIYKNVADRLGLMAHGVNTPGHFLAAIDPPRQFVPSGCGCSRMYIDTFSGGRFLNKQEVLELLERTLGRPVPYRECMLAPATNRQWINRLLQNLQNIFAFNRRESDLHAMQEMAALLQSHS